MLTVVEAPLHSRVWISPVFPKLEPLGQATGGTGGGGFKQDLTVSKNIVLYTVVSCMTRFQEYLKAYRSTLLSEWVELLEGHDTSSAR